MHRSLMAGLLVLLLTFSTIPAVEKEQLMLLITADQAQQIKELISQNDNFALQWQRNLDSLAAAQLYQGPWSVTYYPSKAASGNPHDYYSEGPYWWPDPKNPDGPYIRKDGRANPGRYMAHRMALGEMCDAVLTLGMAGYFLDNTLYAERAAYISKVWFVDEQTRMNPHLEYGQAIHGRTTGRGIGLIDTRSFMEAVLGFYFLDATGQWDPNERQAVIEWFRQFLHWMTTSEKGLDEKKHGNNHSTWWAAQVASYASFVGDEKVLAEVWQLFKEFLVPHQIKPDGSFPREEARTLSLSYSMMNLDGFAYIAHIAYLWGIDLWTFQMPDGAGLQASLNYLTPFYLQPEIWSKQQIKPFRPTRRAFAALAGLDLSKQELLERYSRLPVSDDPVLLLFDMLIHLHR